MVVPLARIPRHVIRPPLKDAVYVVGGKVAQPVRATGSWKLPVVWQGPKYVLIQVLGPLHTRAKSHDHEIVRAQKKLSKGSPKTPPKSCIVVTDLQVYVKSYMTGPSTKCYFNDFLFMWVLKLDKLKINQQF